jgi:hypothetical protein
MVLTTTCVDTSSAREGSEGGGEDAHPGAVGGEEALEEGLVELVDVAGHVDDGVYRVDLQADADVAELEVGVEDDDPFRVPPHGERERDVRRRHRLAGPALGGHDRDDLPQAVPAGPLLLLPAVELLDDREDLLGLRRGQGQVDDVPEPDPDGGTEHLGAQSVGDEHEREVGLHVEQEARLRHPALVGEARPDDRQLDPLLDELPLRVGDVPCREDLVTLEEPVDLLDEAGIRVDDEDRAGDEGISCRNHQRRPPPSLRSGRAG